MSKGNSISIARDWLRVEYNGANETPAKIIVPLVFSRGRHNDVRIRVEPRDGVQLRQSAETGDAFRQTFTAGWSSTIGGSFFGSASYGRANSLGSSQYTVCMTPDFRCVVFQLRELHLHEAAGFQVAFPIESYVPNPTSPFFARVFLEVGGDLIEDHAVPQEVHPQAARILVVDGLSRVPGSNNSPTSSKCPTLPAGPFISHEVVIPDDAGMLISAIAAGCDAVHAVCNVGYNTELQFNGFSISVDEFFDAIDSAAARLVYLDTCNSVQVVSRFRQSNADALIAATENLEVSYADLFAWEFYAALSAGRPVSESYGIATMNTDKRGLAPMIRSTQGPYSPMFLDMKRDFAFMP